jgi:hypothetical protein
MVIIHMTEYHLFVEKNSIEPHKRPYKGSLNPPLNYILTY